MEGHGLKLDLVHMTVPATLTHHFSTALNTPFSGMHFSFVTQVETLLYYNVPHKVILVNALNY